MSNNKTQGQYMKEALKPLVPSQEQQLVKARLTKELEQLEAVVDPASLTLEEIENISGSMKIRKWAKANPSFLPWLLDKDFADTKIYAAKEEIADMLIGYIRRPEEFKILAAKDKLQAANLLLQLMDAFPSKKKEVTFLDGEVAKMDEAQVDRELKKLQNRLGAKKALTSDEK